MQIKKVFRNSFFSVLAQVILIFVGFFSQRVMNLRMGQELVGMNSVISNIIALLSVSELGISTAITYHLYSALAQNQESHIASLMNLYRKAYYLFALAISCMGLLVMPFVHLFLKENNFSLSYIRIIFLLWLFRTVLSYLLSYKRSILIADQREYIVSIATLIANVLNYTAIIIILEWTQNFILALGLNILIEACSNIWISLYVNRKYPFLQRMRHRTPEKNVVSNVFDDLKNIFVTRLSTKLLTSTDSLIISSFISVGIVGLYSNYCLITQSIINVVNALSGALQPSVGHMFIQRDYKKDYQVLRQVSFLFFWISAFVGSCLLSLMTPFVSGIWLGDGYQLPFGIVTLCVINCCALIMGLPLSMTMNVTGLFDRERNLSLITASANLLLSLLLVKPFGIAGVLIGTLVSYLLQIIFRIHFFFHHYLHMSCTEYVADFLQYSVLIAAEAALTFFCTSKVYCTGNILSFITMCIICVLLPNLLNLLLYHRSTRLHSILSLLRSASS